MPEEDDDGLLNSLHDEIRRAIPYHVAVAEHESRAEMHHFRVRVVTHGNRVLQRIRGLGYGQSELYLIVVKILNEKIELIKYCKKDAP
jgi:hypothetical protein